MKSLTQLISRIVLAMASISSSGALLAQRLERVNGRPNGFQNALIVDADAIPGFRFPVANSRSALIQQTRGLIQNELSLIAELCDLDSKQQLALADLAESEWKAKTFETIAKRAQQHAFGLSDLDSLAERSVRTWLESVGTKEQLVKYDAELSDRKKWRQKAMVSRLLDTFEAKLNLSVAQMEQIEAVLNEKWKDRWYLSLEAAFDAMFLPPEIRSSWISPILSDAQRAALTSGGTQPVFVSQQISDDSPALSAEQRFRVGSTVSSESIEVETSSKKSKKTKTNVVNEILKKARAEDLEESDDATKP